MSPDAPGRPGRGARVAVCAVAGLLPLAGCLRTTVVRDGWADFASDAAANGAQVTLGREPGVADALDGRRAGDRPHRLRLAVFEGPQRIPDGQEATLLARGVGGLNELTLVDGDGVAILYGGRYPDASDRDAKRVLQAVKKLEGGEGERPFRDAQLVLLDRTTGAGGVVPADPLDLRGHPGLYTLQLGFFDDDAKPDRRTAAERWANQLRRDERIEAFYYHGPNRSLVTAGLFAQRDFVREGQLDGYPRAARDLQKKFPHNLGNGVPVLEKRPGKDPTRQKSLLVRTPG